MIHWIIDPAEFCTGIGIGIGIGIVADIVAGLYGPLRSTTRLWEPYAAFIDAAFIDGIH